MAAKQGKCHICGTFGKLSYEHFPPHSAFNDKPILKTSFQQLMAEDGDLDELDGKVMQRGMGGYTLCEPCNNNTGKWYGAAYANWAQQGMRILLGTAGKPSLSYPYSIFPLRVLKQIVCMFFSVNGEGFHAGNSDLVRFVLNRESNDFPPNISVFAFYSRSGRFRAAGPTGVIHGLGSGSQVRVYSELAFPPFGFVMTLNNSPPPHDALLDISSFSRFRFSDWRTGITMKLPALDIYTGFPGDYRPREQVLFEAAINRAQAAALRNDQEPPA